MSITLSGALVVGLGGALGAPARYLIDRSVSARTDSDLPWGTFVINVSGALLFGLLTGLTMHHHLPSIALQLLGTGFCGAYTTFSTFSYETVRLAASGQWLEVGVNLAMCLVAGLAGAAAGLGLGLAM
ncbi:MAG TPA: fluoride efflux transporter CrcB [Acidimicrobiales bacterium]|nr:fluoride efflux transporter CrcB [Acidimicrobiales bacterium]